MSAKKAFTTARIVALALIAVAALGLAYLHLATGTSPVSVPKGAHAGQLTLHPCTYATEDGGYRADCGTLVMPENRHDSHSRLIALPVKRIRTLSAHPREPVFRLQGGPGLTNMDFPDASRYARNRDVVLVGYRGVDGSSKLDCPEADSAMRHARDLLGSAYFDAYAKGLSDCAHRLQADGFDLAGYSLPERVDDLEAARRALGYGRIDLLAESAGTRTALMYAWRYPKSIQRSVLVGVNPPGNFVWYPRLNDAQVHKYAALCAHDSSCTARTSDLAATIRETSRTIPDRWGFLRIKPGNARVGAFFGLFHSTDAASPISAPQTIDGWLSASEGDASGLWLLSTMAQLVFPEAQVKGDAAAVARTDAAYARRFFATHPSAGSILGSPGTEFLWAGGKLLDAWPANPDENLYLRVRDSSVETLLVSGNLDFATPPQTARRELLPHLANGHQVVLAGLGHTDDFWSYEPRAGTHLVTTFLDNGRVDASRYTPNRVDPDSGFPQTTIAKIVLASLLGLGALTALSLLVLWVRVRRRGRLGAKSAAAVRTGYVLLLGLGGWFVGVLVALTALPTVPLDDELLVCLSIGLPVGLAVYLAWVDRARPAQTRALGLAASLAGALVGAWLGFNTISGLFAVVTTIVGAAALSNLALIALDIAWERRPAPAPVSPPSPAEPEGGRQMHPPRPHSNLSARMGRWSARHWKTATFGWLAFVLVAFGLGAAVGVNNVDSNAPGPGQSGRMDRILNDGFKQPADEHVLIRSRSGRAGTPAFKAAVTDVVARVSRVAAVQDVRRGAISKNGHAALVDFAIKGDKEKAADKVQPVIDAVAAAGAAHPGFTIGEFGYASAQKGVQDSYNNDLGKAGALSLPITLIILVLAFGALVAAGIPLLLALTAVLATFGLIALPSNLIPVAFEAPAMVLLIGLAVGVDYSMFYLKRERQERAAGKSTEAALEAAAATSGRSVLISGLTVMGAMAGMFLTGDQTFTSLGFATIVVVAVAVLGSLTVLPALLSRLGDNVDRLRVPFVGRLSRADGEGRFWGAIVDRVLGRPALAAALSAGALLALAAPAVALKLAPQGVESFPQSLTVIKTYHQMQQAFPGKALPANVVVKAQSVRTPAARSAIAELKRRALASGRAFEPITTDVNAAGTVADITVPIAGNGTDAASSGAFRTLRGTIVPETVGALPGAEAGVTGRTAGWQDAAAELKSNLAPVIGFVLLFAFALMLVAFRSIVVAAKAIVLNLLSVAAAYGVLVLVFQHGIGRGLLGAGSADGIEVVVPLLLFVILFGLSMDYHVFILSRIRETYDRGATMDEAVSHGIKSTAGVVTSAAIVMVCVFAVFGALSMPFFKQFGVGLAAAILIDATIVRGVLLPATMKLLGDWNWYLPSWLEWLPRLDAEQEPEAGQAVTV
ncbi:MAG TPA: alpha/beta fold hydrolase [Gaiellaceae bacterium]|nr:alpha/beta fold hydrolase [Gaiellaceae bacterium]